MTALIAHQMEMIQRARANKAALVAYEESRKKARAYVPPLSVTIYPVHDPQFAVKGWKMEKFGDLYTAADQYDPGNFSISIGQLGITLYHLHADEHEDLRNTETRKAAAEKIKARMDEMRKPSTLPRMGRP